MEESKFKLPTGIVTVEYIPRKKGLAANVEDNHVISGGMLENAKKRYQAPLKSNGSIANVLTTEEKNYLEQDEVTGLNLSVYGDFWKNYFVTLYKDKHKNRFDLSEPMDYIAIRTLESLKSEIAPTWKDRNKKQTYEFVIVNESEKSDEKKLSLDAKKEAFKAYGRIEDDREKLLSVLKLLSNKSISKTAKLDWIQKEVEEYVDVKPKAFLNVILDKDFNLKSIIHKAVDKGIIQKDGSQYTTEDGLTLAEGNKLPTFDNVIEYLKNPKNQEVLDYIEAKL